MQRRRAEMHTGLGLIWILGDAGQGNGWNMSI